MKKKKLQAAVELGRLGGLKGGPARASKLSATRRSQIARNAANARWANYENEPELQAQIKDGYQSYLRGEGRPIEEFMSELERELRDEKDNRKKAGHRTKRQGR